VEFLKPVRERLRQLRGHPHVGGGERLGHFGGPERAKPLQCDGDKNVASPHRVLIESLPQ